MCPLTEASILAACIVRLEIFEYLTDFGVDHFAVPQHRAVWATMRHLQAHGTPVEVLEICDAIEMRDLEKGSRWADKINPLWFVELLTSTSNYTEERLFDHDVAWLRELEQRRRSL